MEGWEGLHGRPCWGGDRVPPSCGPGEQDAGDREGNKCRSPPLHTTLAPTEA